jgi:hypothetical protein
MTIIDSYQGFESVPLVCISQSHIKVPLDLKVRFDLILSEEEFLEPDPQYFSTFISNYKHLEKKIYKTVLTTFNHKINNVLFKSFFRVSKLKKSYPNEETLPPLQSDLDDVASFLQQMSSLKKIKKELYANDCYMLIDHENLKIPKVKSLMVDHIVDNKRERFEDVGYILSKLNGDVLFKNSEFETLRLEENVQNIHSLFEPESKETLLDLVKQNGLYKKNFSKMLNGTVQNFIATFYLLNTGSDEVLLSIFTDPIK